MLFLDIHYTKRRIESARTSLLKLFSPDNAQVACSFLDKLSIENKSYGRIANYAECIKRILLIKDDKNVSEWTRKEIESVHKAIVDTDYENSVKKLLFLLVKVKF
jgi:hypothetical protein